MRIQRSRSQRGTNPRRNERRGPLVWRPPVRPQRRFVGVRPGPIVRAGSTWHVAPAGAGRAGADRGGRGRGWADLGGVAPAAPADEGEQGQREGLPEGFGEPHASGRTRRGLPAARVRRCPRPRRTACRLSSWEMRARSLFARQRGERCLLRNAKCVDLLCQSCDDVRSIPAARILAPGK